MNTIAIASDHAGYDLKESVKSYLDNLGYEVLDFGTNSKESVDYPDYANELCKSIDDGRCSIGILICHSGIGMSIAANRHKKIRAALCYNPELVRLTRQHNDSNVLVLGSGYVSEELAFKMIDTFLNTEFEGGRHQSRIDKI